MTVTPMVRTELDAEGRWIKAWVPSRSQAGVQYEMVRYASGWAHTDTRCRGWVDNGECYHTKACQEAANVTDTEETTRAITVQLSPLALMDEVDVEEIMQSKLAPSSDWIYSFQMEGQNVTGVSARGVQDAARALSTQGEAIRVLDVRLEREDDQDAYFIATAARFAIAPNGQEIETDRTIRAKRQPKLMKKKTGETVPNRFWFEIGVTKASRNVAEALLPAVLRTYMKEQAKELAAGRVGHTTKATNAPPPAKSAKAKIADLIVEAQTTWDEESFKAYGVKLRERFPKLVTETGRLGVTNLTEEEAEVIAEAIEVDVRGDVNQGVLV